MAKREFQTEVNQLLHLIVHSLYSHPEIFLRELISNASDALEKLRHTQITEKDIFDDKAELEINLTTDDKAKTLTIQDYGVGMAMHFAGTPVSCMANVHCAAATENFMVLENHSVDVPWWSDLVNGVEKPIVNKGYVTVPSGPGLGITLNDEVVKQHLLEPGYFEPTPEWNKERSHDRLWS